MLKFGFTAVAAAFLMVGFTPAEAVVIKRAAVKINPATVKPVCPPRVLPSRN
jgi:hypothetical protein